MEQINADIKTKFPEQLSRIGRAERKYQNLVESIKNLGATEGFLGEDPVIAPDRLSWESTIDTNQATAKTREEWGHELSEAIHHLRSALDTAVHSLVRSAGVTDYKTLLLVKFPICIEQSEWEKVKAMKSISPLPQPYIDTLEKLQPFQPVNSNDALPDRLLVLKELSNTDKHHFQIKPSAVGSSMDHNSWVHFYTKEVKASPADYPVSRTYDQETGVITIRQEVPSPIKAVVIDNMFHFDAHVVIGGHRFDLLYILAAEIDCVRNILHKLATVTP